MVSVSIILFFAVWLVSSLAQLANWLYWIQTKEYRFDRFKVLFGDYHSLAAIRIPFYLLKLTILLVCIFLGTSMFLGISIFLFDDFITLFRALQKKIRRPTRTERIDNIFWTVAIGYLIIFVSLLLGSTLLVSILVGEILVPVLVLVGVFWTRILVKRARNKDMALAKADLSRVKPYVIGITGSYGKSTTKDFIFDLLSVKYNVLKTPENKNTDFGVARTIIENLEDNTQIFVSEMGAYKKGEIKDIAAMVHPKMAVITGIESQHIEIFGSLENIKKAKYELIESLPSRGVAIFNYHNPLSREMSLWAKDSKKLKVYGYDVLGENEKKGGADIVSKILSANSKGIHFEVSFEKSKHNMFVPLSGTHFLENLTAAILVARLKGIAWSSIASAVKNISLSERTMKVYDLSPNFILIDNSYNSNPHGFEAALEYLKFFKNYKKIVVTSGIIELGNMSYDIHKQIGEKMSSVADQVYLTNPHFYKPLRDGLKKSINLTLINDSFALRRTSEKRKAVLLIQGRIPEKIKQSLFKK